MIKWTDPLTVSKAFFEILYKESGYNILLIHPHHIMQYMVLPLHHRDPFDRMLIAQAQSENPTLITNCFISFRILSGAKTSLTLFTEKCFFRDFPTLFKLVKGSSITELY